MAHEVADAFQLGGRRDGPAQNKLRSSSDVLTFSDDAPARSMILATCSIRASTSTAGPSSSTMINAAASRG